MIMRTIGNMMIAENGKEAFELATAKAAHSYEVKQSISGYYRLLCDGEYLHDDSACEDVNEEDSAYYFFAELVKENER